MLRFSTASRSVLSFRNKAQFARKLSTQPKLRDRLYDGHALRAKHRRSAADQLQVNDALHGFRVTSIEELKEYSVHAIQLKHEHTGADYLHIDSDDVNNVFSVCFRTPPTDSTGVPHILEHTVLCGSEKFPVRDPFFNMLKRSLNTFMNAMTASDHTMYPFSTTNEKDWGNLLDVYLDATFFPLLQENDFLQEGHRLELVDAAQDGAKSDLQFKGVVYNEMKGTLADSNTLFAYELQRSLLPDTTYGVVSGGDPKEIPNLTYEQLKAFHKKHYHPSNALFYSYGDLPLEKHLQFLNESLLTRFEFCAESAKISVQNQEPRWNAPRVVEKTCAPDQDMNDQIRIVQSMLAGDSRDNYEAFAMRVLSYLLLNGPSAPMFQALIESQLGTDYVSGTGFDSSTLDSSFGVGVQGVNPENVEKVKQTIRETLEKVVQTGFDKRRIEAVLHQIELSQKHIVGNFGMRMLHGVSSTWCHRGNLVEGLSLNKALKQLQNDMASTALFENLIKKYMLANQHQLTFSMKPDENFVKKQESMEKARLEVEKSKLDEKDLKRLAQRADVLKAWQDQKQDMSCLPSLSVHDVPRQGAPENPIEHSTLADGSVPVQWNFHTTNEVSYVRMLFDTSSLSPELKHISSLCEAFEIFFV